MEIRRPLLISEIMKHLTALQVKTRTASLSSFKDNAEHFKSLKINKKPEENLNRLC